MGDSEQMSREFTVIDAHIRLVVKDAVQEAIKGHVLTSEETQFVKLALKREARREVFQTAVIEKSLVGLVFLVFTFIGVALYDWAVKHGYKP